MVRKLTLDVSEEDYGRLVAAAAAAGTTPEELLLRQAVPLLRPPLPPRTAAPDPARLPPLHALLAIQERRLAGDRSPTGISLTSAFGLVRVDDPNGSDNDRIDADLVRAADGGPG